MKRKKEVCRSSEVEFFITNVRFSCRDISAEANKLQFLEAHTNIFLYTIHFLYIYRLIFEAMHLLLHYLPLLPNLVSSIAMTVLGHFPVRNNIGV